MKAYKKILMLAIVLMCTLFSSKDVYAVGGNSDKITVSNVTDTTANLEWSGMSRAMLGKGYDEANISNIRYTVYVNSQAILQETTLTSYTLTNLTANTFYQVQIDVLFDMGASDGCKEGESESFTTTRTSSIVNVNPNTSPTGYTASTQQPAQSTPALALAKPTVSKAIINRYGTVAALAKNVDVNNTSKLEWQIFDKKTNKCVKTYTSYSTAASISGVNGRKVYYIKCRAVGRDSNYNYVYSDWSDAKYFVTQPKVTSKKSDVHRNSITIKWKKIAGAKSYTVYAKKSTAKKWIKVKTTKGNRFVLNKLKGQTVDTIKNTYNFLVVTNAKAGKQTVKSGKEEGYSAHSYYYYR